MNELVVVYLNGHEIWIEPWLSDDYRVDDAYVLIGYTGESPNFREAPYWLLEMLKNELYDDIMEQLNGEEFTTEFV